MKLAGVALLVLGCGGGTFTAEGAQGGSAGTAGSAAGVGGSSGESPQGGAGMASGGSPAGQGGMAAGSAGEAAGGPAMGGAGMGGESAAGGLGGALVGGLGGIAGDAPIAGSGGEAPVCGRSVGSTAERFIDDLEDGDNVVGNGENENEPPTRVGTWFRFRGEQVPCEGMPLPLVPAESDDSKFASHLAGGGCGVLGLDLNRCGETVKNYDVSAYEGLTFRYRSAYPLRVMIATRANLPLADGGDCTGECGNHHGKNFDAAATWTGATVTWLELSGDGMIGTPPSSPQSFGEARPFKPEQAIGVRVETSSAGDDFDLWLDDLRFL